jgi:hypothetical protein
MCDPVSILLGVGSLLGSGKSRAAPPPAVPAKETRPDVTTEIVKDTGADVAIGGSSGGGESAAVKKLKRNLQRKNALTRPDAAVKTGAAGKTTVNNKAKVGKARQREIEILEEAGLKVGSKGTGIQIL